MLAGPFDTDWIARVLPPWTSAVAYGLAIEAGLEMPAGQILTLPTTDALPSSVDALLLAAEDLPDSRADFSRLLQLLRPGGVALVEIPRDRFGKRELQTLLAANGLRLCANTHGRTGRRIVVFENQGGQAERPALRYSFVIVVDPERPTAFESRAADWQNFLAKRFRCDGTELLFVFDGPADVPEDKTTGEPEMRSIQHYDSFGLAVGALSGLRFARGRRVLVDLCAGRVPVESFFDLLGPMLAKPEHRPDCIVPLDTVPGSVSFFPSVPPYQGGGVAVPRIRRVYQAARAQINGHYQPHTDFFLCNHDLGRRLQPSPLRRKHNKASSFAIPHSGRAAQVPVRAIGPAPEQPGLLRTLLARLRD